MAKFNPHDDEHFGDVVKMVERSISDKGRCDWMELVDEIKLSYKVENWLEVRWCLQWMKDARLIKRSSDVRFEQFVRV